MHDFIRLCLRAIKCATNYAIYNCNFEWQKITMCASHAVVFQTIRRLRAEFVTQISRELFLIHSRFDIAMRQRLQSMKRTLFSGCQETHQQTQLLKFASHFDWNPTEADLRHISNYFRCRNPSKSSYKLPNEIVLRLKRSINEEQKAKQQTDRKTFSCIWMDSLKTSARIFFETKTEGKLCELSGRTNVEFI